MKTSARHPIHSFSPQTPTFEKRGSIRTVLTIFTLALTLTLCAAILAPPAVATSFFFSTGNPDGRIATLSRVASQGKIQTETADDFTLTNCTEIDRATFTGLIPLATPLSSVNDVEIEIYHVFPNDSANPPSGNVPTRANSPGDVEIDFATRDGADGSLSFTPTLLSPIFTVANSVVNGINKSPDQKTNGEGSVTGEAVLITVTFNPPILLP